MILWQRPCRSWIRDDEFQWRNLNLKRLTRKRLSWTLSVITAVQWIRVSLFFLSDMIFFLPTCAAWLTTHFSRQYQLQYPFEADRHWTDVASPSSAALVWAAEYAYKRLSKFSTGKHLWTQGHSKSRTYPNLSVSLFKFYPLINQLWLHC